MSKKSEIIISVFLMLWAAFVITDFNRAKTNRPPLFAIPTVLYKDGGSTEYLGLGYKVIKYINLSPDTGPKVVKVDFGTWFLDFNEENKSFSQ